jgi:hypothetical protein
MSRKIAVLVTDRQEEALRMSIGLTLMDDAVDIYVLNRKLDNTDSIAANLETIKDLELNMYSDYPDQDYAEHVSIDQIANAIADYDHVLPY